MPFGIVGGRALVIFLPGAPHAQIWIGTCHPCCQAVLLQWMPASETSCEAHPGTRQVFDLLAVLRGVASLRFDQVQGGGTGEQ